MKKILLGFFLAVVLNAVAGNNQRLQIENAGKHEGLKYYLITDSKNGKEYLVVDSLLNEPVAVTPLQ